jgi:hypothetical protein
LGREGRRESPAPPRLAARSPEPCRRCGNGEVGEEGGEKDDPGRRGSADWGRREWRGGGEKEYDAWGPQLVVDMEFET